MASCITRVGSLFFISCLLVTPLVAQASTWVPAEGNVRTADGTPVCAMVLANGQFTFSCDGTGAYDLSVPLDADGKITLFSFADGFAPFKVTTNPDGFPLSVQMQTAAPDSPLISMTRNTEPAANNSVRISGEIESSDGVPLCAMVLANGQHMFTCGDALGRYDLTVPVSTSGQVTVFGFADGFQPYGDTFVAPVCSSSIVEHCQISAYSGPEVCVACHEGQARDMHGSVHYQQGGAFPNVTNIPLVFTAAGERPAKAAGDLVATGINTYCGTHENSPRFTCAGCHVGNGRFPMVQSEFEQLDPASAEAHAQLANIDCLMCHQEVYKRFPDWTANGAGFTDLILLNLAVDPAGNLIQADGNALVRTGLAGIPNIDPSTLDFQFLPAGRDTLPDTAPTAPMAFTTLQAAREVHATTRKSCLNCHAGAAGADGAKRGDMSKENVDPSIAMDMHMSAAGANLTCSDCHNETLPDGTGHRMRGRGLDLRPNDVAQRFACENSGCHTDRPHDDFSNTNGESRDTHAMKVACQTCHIPSYAKAAVGTEVARDWQDPHPSAAACNGRGGWLPREDKGGLDSSSLIPSYAWFDGTSEIYYLGESLDAVPTVPLAPDVAANFVGGFNAGDPTYVIGMPNGDVSSTSLVTKLYPMKEHWSKLARNNGNNTLVGHSTFEFFRTGSFCRAVAVGLGLDEANQPSSSVCNGLPGDTEMPPNTTTVAVHTYQTINHGVEPKDNALECGACHASYTDGGPVRMDLKGDLGYRVKGNYDSLGASSDTCTACHEPETESEGDYFSFIHHEHVREEGKDCSVCHSFSRPERGLSTSIEWDD